MNDKVKLKVINLIENTSHIKDEIFERSYLERWVQHQRDNAGTGVLDWEIVEA